MHQINLPGLIAHAADEIEQPLLIGVRRIAFQNVVMAGLEFCDPLLIDVKTINRALSPYSTARGRPT